MNNKEARVKSILFDLFKGKAVIVGIGNVLKGDDAFGPALIERIQGRTRALCIDAGSAPENYTGKIIKEEPASVLIVDAAHLELSPGEYDILKKEEILKCGFTTHDLSPRMFMEFLEEGTRADIYMLAVQAEKVKFGEEMTESVKKALEEIAELIVEAGNA